MKNLSFIILLCLYIETGFSQAKKDEFNRMIDSSVKMTYRSVKEDLLNRHQTTNYLQTLYLIDKQDIKVPVPYVDVFHDKELNIVGHSTHCIKMMDRPCRAIIFSGS